MNVHFTDSFTKSLKRLMWHESKVYKFYALFRYDIAHFIKTFGGLEKNFGRIIGGIIDLHLIC